MLKTATVALTLVMALCCTAHAKDPPVPPGADPGGVAVALLSLGVDYTRPEVAARLARDGEGDLIAWDLVDSDNRPFPAPPEPGPSTGDAVALALIRAAPGVRLILVRLDSRDPATLARAMAFIGRTPARIVIVSPPGLDAAHWEPFRQAVAYFNSLLFITSPGQEGEPAAQPNMLIVRPGGNGSGSADLASAGARAVAIHAATGATGADLRAAIDKAAH